MATRLQSLDTNLSRLEEQITCAICLEHFCKPIILPCLHTFCLGCLERLPIQLVKGSYYLCCPICRSSCPVPDKGLTALPPSFIINNLMEVYDLMKKVSDQHTAICDNCQDDEASQYCKQCASFFCSNCLQYHYKMKRNTGHETIASGEVASTADQLLRTRAQNVINCIYHSKPLAIFCETCQELICHLCTIAKHKAHKYDLVLDVYKRYRDALVQSCLQPLNREFDRLTQAKVPLVGRIDKVNQQAETTSEEIDHMITQVKEHLDSTGRRMKDTVNKVRKLKVEVLEHQLKEMDTTVHLIQESRDYVEQLIEMATPHQLLSSKAQVMARSKDVIDSTREKRFQSLEEADIKLVKKIEIESFHNYVGDITFSSSIPFRVSMVSKNAALLSQQSTVAVSLSPVQVPSSFIKCHLIPPNDHSYQPVECTIKESSQSEQYDVVFTPSMRGRHQLHVTIQGKEVEGSPVGVAVTVPLEMMSKPVKTITGLKNPFGVAVTDDGEIVVSEGNGDCISILSKEGHRIRSIGSKGNAPGKFMVPKGVAVTSSGTVLVVDKNNHRIQELTMEGKVVRCFGSKGSGPQQFNLPCGIAIDKTTGKVFVVDFGNHRVQVFTSGFTFCSIVGRIGSRHGEFLQPYDIAIDSKGFFYVTDGGNNRIQKFTIDGRYVACFERGKYQLYCPSGLTLDDCDDKIYVNSNNIFVTVFSTNGQQLGIIDQKSMGSVYFRGIFLHTKTGLLYVCCSDDNVIKVF